MALPNGDAAVAASCRRRLAGDGADTQCEGAAAPGAILGA